MCVKSEKGLNGKEVEGEEEEDEVEGFSPRPYTLPNTPSSARTEHQSSGLVSTSSLCGIFKINKNTFDPRYERELPVIFLKKRNHNLAKLNNNKLFVYFPLFLILLYRSSPSLRQSF